MKIISSSCVIALALHLSAINLAQAVANDETASNLSPEALVTDLKKDFDGCSKEEATTVKAIKLVPTSAYLKWWKKANIVAKPKNKNSQYIEVVAGGKLAEDQQKTGMYGPISSSAKLAEFQGMVGKPFCAKYLGD